VTGSRGNLVRITVKLIGQLVDLLPASGPLAGNPRARAHLDVADDHDLAALLRDLGLPPDLEYFAMINEEHVPAAELPARALKDGDAVVLLPPLKGG
jgi:sulfur carrier protein ThiS